MQAWSLGREDPLEEGIATHPSILAWRILWTEELGELQSILLQRYRHNWSDLACMQALSAFGPNGEGAGPELHWLPGRFQAWNLCTGTNSRGAGGQQSYHLPAMSLLYLRKSAATANPSPGDAPLAQICPLLLLHLHPHLWLPAKFHNLALYPAR